MDITQEFLRDTFEYKDGVLLWKHRRRNCSKPMQVAGWAQPFVKNTGERWCIRIRGTVYLRSRLIFLYHKGYLPKIVDHADRNKLNDCIDNLREASDSQNCRNSTSRRGSSSKYLGVHRHMGRTWVAQIKIDGKCKVLGSYPIEEDAAFAYNYTAEKLFGKFANLNKLPSDYINTIENLNLNRRRRAKK